MPTTKLTTPFVGLALVILSIAMLKIESTMFAAISLITAIFGLILILLPDLKGIKMKPREPLVRRGPLPTLNQPSGGFTDRCAICGKPVPPDVAYCDECAKKKG